MKDGNSSSEDVNELADMLDAVANGRRVEVVPPHAELTIREAPDVLLVSEPFLYRSTVGRSPSATSTPPSVGRLIFRQYLTL